MMSRNRKLPSLKLSIAIFLVILAGCISRYRMDLFLIAEGEPQKLKIEESTLVPNSVIGDPYADVKLRPGSHHTLKLITSMRGKPLYSRPEMVISLDEYFRCCFFVHLPAQPRAESITLEDQSFVQVLGQWEVPSEEKIFLPVSGNLVVDSVASKKLYATIEGRFENRSGKSLEYRGQFKASIGGLPSEDQD